MGGGAAEVLNQMDKLVRIDAHQHYWRIDRSDYGWLTPALDTLYRDFLPEDLAAILKRHGIDRTIAVQAAPTVAETEFLLGLARQTGSIAGVVGWVDFAESNAPSTIARLARERALVGLRPMVQDIADDDWLLRPELAPSFGALIEHQLVFDALVLPRHLPRLARVVARYPQLTVVIDHGAKPPIREGVSGLDPWREDIAALAAAPRVHCKLSGLVTEASKPWQIEDLRPYVDHLLSTFGAEKLIWGSDWPVVERGGGYDRWRATSFSLLEGLDSRACDAVLGGNAAQVYLQRGVRA
jgi:L-fuconolactonase